MSRSLVSLLGGLALLVPGTALPECARAQARVTRDNYVGVVVGRAAPTPTRLDFIARHEPRSVANPFSHDGLREMASRARNPQNDGLLPRGWEFYWLRRFSDTVWVEAYRQGTPDGTTRAIRILTQGAAPAGRTLDARDRYLVGRLYQDLGELDSATHYYGAALDEARAQLARVDGTYRGDLGMGRQAQLLILTAEIYGSLGWPEPAREHLVRAVRVQEAARDWRGAAWTHLYLGVLATNAGRAEQAAASYAEGAGWMRVAGDAAGEALAARAAAATTLAAGDPAGAVQWYGRAAAAARAGGDETQEASALEGLASALAEQGKAPEALAALADADAIYRRQGSDVGTMRILYRMARVEAADGALDDAIRHYRRLLEAARHAGSPALLAVVEQELATAYEARGDFADARACLRRAVALLERADDDDGAAAARARLSALDAAGPP